MTRALPRGFDRLASLLLALALTALPSDLVRASRDHGGGDRADEQTEARAGDHPDDHGGERDAFDVATFEQHGVRVATAGPGRVDSAIELPGEIRPNGDRIAHLAPRFPGIAREVRKRVGDSIVAGETMALIAGDNLATFPLEAAFAGTVIDRHVTPGEVVSPERAAFIVADLSTVWVEIDVYQRALDRVRVGGPVEITAGRGGESVEGIVSYVSPVVDQATRTARARVVLANPHGRWRPGSFVTALVHDPSDAAVVVPRRAVHRLGGEPVVFVVSGDHFTPRVVTLGRVGRSRVAIAQGLEPGERYADEGSFLVKAEIAKGEGAEHEH